MVQGARLEINEIKKQIGRAVSKWEIKMKKTDKKVVRGARL